MKTCTKCGQSKPLTGFPNKRARKDGKGSWCSACDGQYTREWNSKNPGVRRANQQNDHIRRRYGLSREEYIRLHQDCSGECRICKEPIEQFDRQTHVDHDHATGQIRGLLCRPCNLGLGYFKDSPERLSQAIKYLEKAREHESTYSRS